MQKYRVSQNELSGDSEQTVSIKNLKMRAHQFFSTLGDENHSWRNKNAHIRESCVSGRVLHKTDGMKMNVFSPGSKEELMCTHF